MRVNLNDALNSITRNIKKHLLLLFALFAFFADISFYALTELTAAEKFGAMRVNRQYFYPVMLSRVHRVAGMESQYLLRGRPCLLQN